MRDRFQEGIDFFQKVINSVPLDSPRKDEQHILGLALAIFGHLSARIGLDCQADESLARARDLLRQVDARRDLAIACLYGGLTTNEQEYYEFRKEALEILRDFDDPFLHAYANLRMGKSLMALGKDEEARQYAIRGFRLSVQIGDRLLQAPALQYLAWIAYNLGNYDEAFLRNQEGYELYKAGGQTRGVADTLIALSLCARMLGQMNTAVQYLTEGLAVYSQLRDRGQVAGQLLSFGLMALRANDVEGAAQLLQESLVASRQADRTEILLIAQQNLDDIREGRRGVFNAKLHFQPTSGSSNMD